MRRLMLAAVGTAMAALAADAPAPDPVLSAMRDEIARASKLTVSNLDAPYFIQYLIDEGDAFSVSASFGGLLARRRDHLRQPEITVRVGDYKFDNTNFAGRVGGTRYDLGRWPLDDSYPVLRRYFWLATDSAYKSAVETISRKRAALRNLTESNPGRRLFASPADELYPRAGPPRDRRERLGGAGARAVRHLRANIPECWIRAWNWRPRPAATTW